MGMVDLIVIGGGFAGVAAARGGACAGEFAFGLIVSDRPELLAEMA
jgi:glycine/D-amino acid oxidase-like deaminating enzyme